MNNRSKYFSTKEKQMSNYDFRAGTEFKTHAFGVVFVKDEYMHRETGERCLNIKAETGETMHFSLEYARKLQDEGRRLI